MKYFVYTIISIVTLSIVAGFFIVGSPKEERMRQFDEQRVGHMQFMQSEILNYWINKGKLPVKLADLEDDLRGVRVPTDPETGVNYEYEVLGSEKFSLCANFSLPTLGMTTMMGKSMMPRPVEPYGQQNWEHQTGSHCFERTIDKDFYPAPSRALPFSKPSPIK